MNKITLPKDMRRRMILYSKMLDLGKNNSLTFKELEELCIKRGYLSVEKEVQEK